MAVSRWKSSVGSEMVEEGVSESESSSAPEGGLVGFWHGRGCSGIVETDFSRDEFRVLRLEEVVSNREWRASLREAIMGETRYLLVP